MSQLLNSAVKKTAARLSELIEFHRSQRDITFPEHVRVRRRERVAHLGETKRIYLDTLAWKCMADYRQRKPSLTAAMVTFGKALEQAAQSGNFVFPIGLPTFFELDSMTSPQTRAAVTELVDELSQGFCIVPYHERVGDELWKLRSGALDKPDTIEDFLCSPIELLGIPAISLPGFVQSHVDENTFNKAFYDALSELPFSIQMEVAGSLPGAKWDNSCGIADLNEGKDAHQAEIANLNTGIFIELKGLIDTWFTAEEIDVTPKDIGLYALMALYHWKQNPTSQALPTLRTLSSLYGLMRFDSQRRYRDGDPNDFLVAASALPVAHALFTDRKFANFLADPRIDLLTLSDCTIVSGFEEMAKYLTDPP